MNVHSVTSAVDDLARRRQDVLRHLEVAEQELRAADDDDRDQRR